MSVLRRAALSVSVLFFFFTIPSWVFPTTACAYEEPMTLLQALVDSLSATSGGDPNGLDPVADSLCYSALPDSLVSASFKKLFHIYASDGVLNGFPQLSEGWSAAQWDTFTTTVYDGDSTTTTDIFPIVWNYFALGDAAAAEDSLAFPGPEGSTAHNIEFSIYHTKNWCGQDADSCAAGAFCDTTKTSLESRRYGSADANTILFYVNTTTDVDGFPHWELELESATQAVGGLAHELQHLADKTDGWQLLDSELRSTAAEYLAGIRWEEHRVMEEVNVGLAVKRANNSFAPYNLYRLFTSYLFGHFSESPSISSDDLVYKAIRYIAPGDSVPRSLMSGMGAILMSDFPDSVAGSDADEKMGNLYHRFAMARYASDSSGYAGGIYGFGPSGVSARHFGWFEWVNTVKPRVEWLPPDILVGEDLLGTEESISTWTDEVDTVHVSQSRDLTLTIFGSEYVVFRADSTYFSGAPSQTLQVTVESLQGVPADLACKIGYLEYGSASGDLFEHPLLSATESVPITLTGSNLNTTFQVEDFGGDTQGVVLVASMVQDPISTSWNSSDLRSPLPIEVTYRFVADTTQVPGTLEKIQDAIDAGGPGDVVLVQGKAFGFAYEETIQLSNGARVIGIDSGHGLPILNGESNATTVSFPTGASSVTGIEGFTIRGGTQEMIRLRGSGQVINCTLDSLGTDPLVGIFADSTGAGALIDDCEIDLASGTGVYLNDGSAVIQDCRVRIGDGTSTNTGLLTTASGGAGDFDITRTLVVVPGGTGIDVGTSATTVTQCTIDSVATGVVNDGGTVNRTMVGYHTSAGFDGDPVAWCIADAPTAYGSGDAAKGTGCVTEDPLFCAAGEYTLRVDSYGNKKNNGYTPPLEGQIGAYGVECLHGTLVRSTESDTGDTLEVLGDVEITAPWVLTLSEGTVLGIGAGDDRAELGSDDTRVEILVRNGGQLIAEGTESDSVMFAPLSGGEGTWAGIKVNQGFLKIDHAVVKGAVVGADCDSVTTGSFVTNCSFVENQSRALRVLGVNGTGVDVLIEDNAFIVTGCTGCAAIELGEACSRLQVNTNQLTGSASSAYGILVTDGSPKITQNSVTGFSNGSPLRIEGGSPTVTKNTLQNSKYAIHVFVSSGTASPSIGTTNSSSDNILTSNTDGVRCEKSGAQPSLRNNQIYGNTNGVVARSEANPFLGNTGDDAKNSIYSNSGNCIRNLNTSQGLVAKGNWFGNCSAPTCTHGTVLVLDWLCAQPAGAPTPTPKIEALQFAPGLTLRGVVPNPMRSEARFVLELGQPAAELRVRVFDVAGRLVHEIRREGVESGIHEIPWDGRTMADGQVSDGIYFILATADRQYRETAKVLVAR